MRFFLGAKPAWSCPLQGSCLVRRLNCRSSWFTGAPTGRSCGVEIIRRVMEHVDAKSLNGTLLGVPIVNVHGFNSGDRYLPDRRDLNRSFPGSARGSLAARIAHLMMTEIVAKSTLGIDLHTGSSHRTNLPQIRANLDDAETFRLAKVFGAQIAIHSQTRDGSLRQAGTEAGATVLLYEAGEAYRFDELSIRVGTEGVLRVLGDVGMVEARPLTQSGMGVSRSTRWLRAGKSGIVHIDVDLGEAVESGSVVARVFDPFGKVLGRVRSPIDGVVIGLSRLPLVNRGDALLHIAELSSGAVPESEGS